MDVLLDPTWKRISLILKVLFPVPYARWEVHEIYAGNLNIALDDLQRVVTRSSDRDHTRESRDILKQYLVPIFKFAGKAAVDSAESRGIGTYPIAKLLRLSETFLRAEDSPSNFINIARNLRRELISVLAMVRERDDLYYRNDRHLGTLSELIRLFSALTARSMSPTISSNEDDLSLVSLFSPILQHLQAVTGDPGWVMLEGEDSVSDVIRLDRRFKHFKAAVESVSRKMKRRDRDPESGWCHWREENLNAMGH